MCAGSQRASPRFRNSQALTRAPRRLAQTFLCRPISAPRNREADGLDLARRAGNALEADGFVVHHSANTDMAEIEFKLFSSWSPTGKDRRVGGAGQYIYRSF